MGYITPQGDSAIRQFKYKGGDLSISYQYIWSPFAELILKVTPQTFAPNLITVVGFLAHVIGTIVLISQGSFGSQAPSWSLWLYGITVFIYQNMDNVDGKQARKLGNSTPLGMIMDHGCDALGLIFLTLGMARTICLDESELILWVFTFGVTFGFYVSAWCQYYSAGIMILGKVNAVDDGIPVIWMCAFYSAIFGQSFWITPVTIFGTTIALNSLIAYCIAFSGIIQVYSLYSQAADKFTNDLKKALFDLIHLILIGFAVYAINVHSDLCQQYFGWIMVGVGFTMARTISYTLLCSVSQMKFQQFHPSVLIFGLVYPIYIFFDQKLVNSSFIVYPITAFIVLQYFYFVVNVCLHIAKVLNIRVFHVFDPKQIKKQ